MHPHATPANHTISTSLSLSLLSLSLWSPGHTTTLVPHRPPPPVFHTTFRVPVLDHPNSKLWAGGQGRQAQRRRGTPHTTNRMIEPQTRWGTCHATRRRHDTLCDGHRDSPATPPAGPPRADRDPGACYASSAGAGEGERPRCEVRRHYAPGSPGRWTRSRQLHAIPLAAAPAGCRVRRSRENQLAPTRLEPAPGPAQEESEFFLCLRSVNAPRPLPSARRSARSSSNSCATTTPNAGPAKSSTASPRHHDPRHRPRAPPPGA
jgi:hypothetical protein